MRFIIVLLLLTSLSACKYTSDANLHGGKKFYTPSGFFATGTHYFVADDGSEYLKLVVSSTTAHVSSLEVSGTTPYSATLTGGFAPEQSGANFYIAVETESSGYSYYPFKFTRDPKWISWAKPSASTEVTSLSDLVTKAKAQFSSGLDTDFRPTTAQQWNKAVEDARARARPRHRGTIRLRTAQPHIVPPRQAGSIALILVMSFSCRAFFRMKASRLSGSIKGPVRSRCGVWKTEQRPGCIIAN